MRKLGLFRTAVLWFAVGGVCIPQVAMGAPPAPKPVGDVVLRDGKILLGQVVTPEGKPLPGISVALRDRKTELAAGKTNENGYFAFSGLTTGTYQVVGAQTTGTYQVWTKDLAPPTAQPGALIVAGGETVRGQYPAGQYAGMIGRPLIIGGLVAAAIAIPIAVSSNRSSGSH